MMQQVNVSATDEFVLPSSRTLHFMFAEPSVNCQSQFLLAHMPGPQTTSETLHSVGQVLEARLL